MTARANHDVQYGPRQAPPTKESGRSEKIATSIVVTAGERPLYSAEPVEELARGHLELLAERDALREVLTEVGKWLSIQDSPPIGTNAVLVEIERALESHL